MKNLLLFLTLKIKNIKEFSTRKRSQVLLTADTIKIKYFTREHIKRPKKHFTNIIFNQKRERRKEKQRLDCTV